MSALQSLVHSFFFYADICFFLCWSNILIWQPDIVDHFCFWNILSIGLKSVQTYIMLQPLTRQRVNHLNNNNNTKTTQPYKMQKAKSIFIKTQLGTDWKTFNILESFTLLISLLFHDQFTSNFISKCSWKYVIYIFC